jgi:hypothetical protein
MNQVPLKNDGTREERDYPNSIIALHDEDHLLVLAVVDMRQFFSAALQLGQG